MIYRVPESNSKIPLEIFSLSISFDPPANFIDLVFLNIASKWFPTINDSPPDNWIAVSTTLKAVSGQNILVAVTSLIRFS